MPLKVFLNKNFTLNPKKLSQLYRSRESGITAQVSLDIPRLTQPFSWHGLWVISGLEISTAGAWEAIITNNSSEAASLGNGAGPA